MIFFIMAINVLSEVTVHQQVQMKTDAKYEKNPWWYSWDIALIKKERIIRQTSQKQNILQPA